MQKIKNKNTKLKKKIKKNARLGRHCSKSQPAGTKNVVSIFIEVLYSSRVENIYYLNYISGKGQDFVESGMWLLYTRGAVCDWNYWLSVTIRSPGNLSKGKATINAVNRQRRELCSLTFCSVFLVTRTPRSSPFFQFPSISPFVLGFVPCSSTLGNHLPNDFRGKGATPTFGTDPRLHTCLWL